MFQPIPAIVLLSGPVVFATGTLDFCTNGYCLSAAVSLDSGTLQNPIRIGIPGSSCFVEVRSSDFAVLRYDLRKQRFLAILKNHNFQTLPKTLKIKVRGNSGVFIINGKHFPFRANWVLA